MLPCAAAAHAQELSTHDPDGGMRQFGVWGQAERIVHEGKPWVLVRLQVQEPRYRSVKRGNGVTEYVEIREPFVPFDLACDAATMDVRGTTVEADAMSPCRETRRITRGGGMPMYVVFPYPEPGAVSVYVPITVIGGESPGATELRLSVLIPTPRK